MPELTPQQKQAIERQISQKVTLLLASLGCTEMSESVTLRDTDIAPLQPQIGDHVTFAFGGLIRLRDFLDAGNQAPE